MTKNTSRSNSLPSSLLWSIGAATFLAAAILIFAVVLGVRAGQRQIEIQTRQQVGIHLQRAIDYRAEGRASEAMGEYQVVLQLDPDNSAAQEGVESLLQLTGSTAVDPAASTSTPAATPPQQVAAALQPTATPDSRSPIAAPGPTASVDALTAQWETARTAYSAGRWKETADHLLRIQQTNPTFKSVEVADMLYTVYVNLAAEADQADNLEQALAYVDKALALRPDVPELTAAREKAATYLNALAYVGVNWEQTIALLDQLHTLDPNYRDVEDRLQAAHVALGDKLAGEQDWCAAQEQYIAALDIYVTQGLMSKRDQARGACTDAASAAAAGDTLSASVSAAPGALESAARPAGAGPGRGRVLYSARDVVSGRTYIFAQPLAAGAKPQVLVEDGAQPAMRGDGQRLAYINLRSDMGGISAVDPSSGLALRFTSFSEDRLPSWNPEANRVVFASNREGDRRWRIYSVWADADGEVSTLGFGESPAWNPVADLIIFRGCDDTGNRCGLWTMNGAGSNRQPLTDLPGDTHPAWTPDGRSVVFMSNERSTGFDLYTVDLATGSVMRLTDNPAIDGAPAVSPDGAWVAFLSNRDGGWKIWAMPVDGGEAVPIAAPAGELDDWTAQKLQWID